jgi:aspartyl-tRNA(Asn)/glutamyl-tRNA(Gln) amidotransferase subunit B
MGELLGALNREGLGIEASPVSPAQLGSLLARIADETISGKIAKQVFEAMWQGEGDADQVIEKNGLRQITDRSELERIVDEVIAANPEQAAQYRAGKDKLIGFFVGQVMRATQGKGNPAQVNALLAKKLSAG